MNLHKKVVTTAAVTIALSMVGTAASAHECFVVNRSAKATEMVSEKSPMWFGGSVAEVYGFIHTFGIPGVDVRLTEEEVAFALDHIEEAGGSLTVAIFEGATIPRGKGFTGGADGKGIDHAFHPDGLIIQAYLAARAASAA